MRITDVLAHAKKKKIMLLCQEEPISQYCSLRFLYILEKETSFTKFGNTVPLIASKQLSDL